MRLLAAVFFSWLLVVVVLVAWNNRVPNDTILIDEPDAGPLGGM